MSTEPGVVVTGNTVNITGGTVFSVNGGSNQSSLNGCSAESNTVNIESGTVTGTVCGGESKCYHAKENTVNISGGNFSRYDINIYAARGSGNTDNTMMNNSITLSGTTRGLDNANLYGAYNGGISFTNGGNTLNIGTVHTDDEHPGAAWTGKNVSGAVTNAVKSLTGFDVIKFNTVQWDANLPALTAEQFQYAYAKDEEGDWVSITDLTSDLAKANNISSTLDVTGLSFRQGESAYTPKAKDTMTLLASDTANNFAGLGLKYKYNGAGDAKTETLTAEGVTVGAYKVADDKNANAFYKNLILVSLANDNKAVSYTYSDTHLSYTDKTNPAAGAVTLYVQPSASDTEAGYTVNDSRLNLADNFNSLTIADGAWDKPDHLYGGYNTSGASLQDYTLSVTGGSMSGGTNTFVLCGAYADGGASGQEAAISGNTLHISGSSSINAPKGMNLYGGHIANSEVKWNTGADGSGPNKVIIDGGTLTSSEGASRYTALITEPLNWLPLGAARWRSREASSRQTKPLSVLSASPANQTPREPPSRFPAGCRTACPRRGSRRGAYIFMP